MDLILLATPWHDSSFWACGQSSDQCPCCVSCVPHPLKHQRSDHSVSTVSRVPHPLSHPQCVWRGLWEGGKEIQRAIVHQGEGDGFRNCLVKFSWEERGCFLLLQEAGGWGVRDWALALSTLAAGASDQPRVSVTLVSPPVQEAILLNPRIRAARNESNGRCLARGR